VLDRIPAIGFLAQCPNISEAVTALEAVTELVTGGAPPALASAALALLVRAVDEPECCRILRDELDATRRLAAAFLHNHSTVSAPTIHAENVGWVRQRVGCWCAGVPCRPA